MTTSRASTVRADSPSASPPFGPDGHAQREVARDCRFEEGEQRLDVGSGKTDAGELGGAIAQSACSRRSRGISVVLQRLG
jgi:hypothetical protein